MCVIELLRAGKRACVSFHYIVYWSQHEILTIALDSANYQDDIGPYGRIDEPESISRQHIIDNLLVSNKIVDILAVLFPVISLRFDEWFVCNFERDPHIEVVSTAHHRCGLKDKLVKYSDVLVFEPNVYKLLGFPLSLVLYFAL